MKKSEQPEWLVGTNKLKRLESNSQAETKKVLESAAEILRMTQEAGGDKSVKRG